MTTHTRDMDTLEPKDALPTITPSEAIKLVDSAPQGLASLIDHNTDGGSYCSQMCWQALRLGELHELEGADIHLRVDGREYRVSAE